MDIENNEFVKPDALAAEEYTQVKALFARGVFELEVSGEDLVLNAECAPDPTDEMVKLYPRSVDVREIARVKLKQIIAHSVPQFLEEGEDDRAVTRSEIFALAGRLRELAALVEEEASELDETEWNKYLVATIKPDEEAEAKASEDDTFE